MRCLELPKGFLKSLELLEQTFALLSLLFVAGAKLLTYVNELLLGIVLLVITLQSSLAHDTLSSLASYYTLVGFAIRRVDRVSKRDDLL
jgi:hypothetical protein